jgi:hypothetical protein
VKVDEVASPLAFVVSVSVFVPLPNLPLAPEEGAVNVTETPLVGVPFVVTSATKGFANAVPTVALCPDPVDTAMTGTGAAVLVSLKFTGLAATTAAAATL